MGEGEGILDMKKALPLALAAAAFSFGAPAYAADVVVGGGDTTFTETNVGGDDVADPDYTATFTTGTSITFDLNPSGASFDEKLIFTLSNIADLVSANFGLSFVPNTNPASFNITSYTISGGTLGGPVDLLSFVNTPGNLALGNGTYTLSLVGTSTAADGSINGNVFLSAVPEPATWMMLLLGFFGVGLALRRQKSADEAELTFMKAA